jgi:uncharacterized protein
MTDKFIWYELMTTDRDAALDFYKAVVGWTSAVHPNSTPDGMRYDVLSAAGRAIGGVFQLTDEMRSGGARPGWVGYVDVADTDAKAKEAIAAGGSVLMGPDDIPNVGRFAMLADPGGAPFYLLTPSPQEGEPVPLDPEAPGAVSWHELYSGVGEKAAFAFYSGLFGWQTMTEMPMGEMGLYRIFGDGDVQMGGMMDKPPNVPVSAWAFYINVDGIDAAVERVKAKGGQILMGPQEVPGGSWIIQGVDPQGANFAFVSQTR